MYSRLPQGRVRRRATCRLGWAAAMRVQRLLSGAQLLRHATTAVACRPAGLDPVSVCRPHLLGVRLLQADVRTILGLTPKRIWFRFSPRRLKRRARVRGIQKYPSSAQDVFLLRLVPKGILSCSGPMTEWRDAGALAGARGYGITSRPQHCHHNSSTSSFIG